MSSEVTYHHLLWSPSLNNFEINSDSEIWCWRAYFVSTGDMAGTTQPAMFNTTAFLDEISRSCWRGAATDADANKRVDVHKNDDLLNNLSIFAKTKTIEKI